MRWSLFLFLLVALPALYIATLLVLGRGRGPLTECIWLGTLGGDESEAFGVSMGGSVVVGRSKNADGRWRAFRWTQAGGMQDLGTLGGDESVANCVSAGGSVVVGSSENAAGHLRAFRWTQAGGMQDLGTLGGNESMAYSVSADGSVVVGAEAGQNADGHLRAFRWTQASGMQDLGTLGGDESMAYSVSADGSVVVGAAENADGHLRAFRWTQAGGMQDLGTLGGNESMAYSVSADGSVVVGMATKKVEGFIGGRYERRYVRFEVARIFRWTQASGMKELSDYLYRPQVTAISPDGRYIAGYGYKSLWLEPRKAFLLVTRE
jgi:probable HAF family extracellular repeat protein